MSLGKLSDLFAQYEYLLGDEDGAVRKDIGNRYSFKTITTSQRRS
ncbi:MAG: hypothetical protein AB1714_16880 [Acidobacteriota bacterium]